MEVEEEEGEDEEALLVHGVEYDEADALVVPSLEVSGPFRYHASPSWSTLWKRLMTAEAVQSATRQMNTSTMHLGGE